MNTQSALRFALLAAAGMHHRRRQCKDNLLPATTGCIAAAYSADMNDDAEALLSHLLAADRMWYMSAVFATTSQLLKAGLLNGSGFLRLWPFLNAFFVDICAPGDVRQTFDGLMSAAVPVMDRLIVVPTAMERCLRKSIANVL